MRFLSMAATAAAVSLLGTPAAAQVVFYEHDEFTGRSFVADKSLGNLESAGFDQRASSIVVVRERWEVCTGPRFEGRCRVARPGRYPSLAALGLDDRIASIRPVAASSRVEDGRWAPEATLAIYDNHRRPNERLFEANVTSARAVYSMEAGPPCWLDRAAAPRGGVHIPSTVAGDLVGGVLAYQIVRGTAERDPPDATAPVPCRTLPAAGRPDHWEVTYEFRGQAHRMRMLLPPGNTVAVNALGEPRS